MQNLTDRDIAVTIEWTSTDKAEYLWPLLLTWFNFNPSLDK